MGQEWYSLGFYDLFVHNFPLIILVMVTFMIKGRKILDVQATTVYYFLIFLFLMLCLTKSSRFIEYLPPFIILFCATLMRDGIEDHERICAFLKSCNYRKTILAVLIVLLFSFIFIKLHQWKEIANKASFPHERFKHACEWLKDNTEHMETVYNVSWSDFPQLFYWGHWNTYICGLDPNFIQGYDSELASLYFNISHGNISNPGYIISKYFKSKYVIVSKKMSEYYNFGAFIKLAKTDFTLKKVYEDRYSIIYETVIEK